MANTPADVIRVEDSEGNFVTTRLKEQMIALANGTSHKKFVGRFASDSDYHFVTEDANQVLLDDTKVITGEKTFTPGTKKLNINADTLKIDAVSDFGGILISGKGGSPNGAAALTLNRDDVEGDIPANDNIAEVIMGAGGSDMISSPAKVGAKITAIADGDWAVGDQPTRLEIAVTPDGSSSVGDPSLILKEDGRVQTNNVFEATINDGSDYVGVRIHNVSTVAGTNQKDTMQFKLNANDDTPYNAGIITVSRVSDWTDAFPDSQIEFSVLNDGYEEVRLELRDLEVNVNIPECTGSFKVTDNNALEDFLFVSEGRVSVGSVFKLFSTSDGSSFGVYNSIWVDPTAKAIYFKDADGTVSSLDMTAVP